MHLKNKHVFYTRMVTILGRRISHISTAAKTTGHPLSGTTWADRGREIQPLFCEFNPSKISRLVGNMQKKVTQTVASHSRT